MSLRGYWRTESDRMDCNPAIRITRFTTTASTGRRMNRSVNFILTILRFRSGIVAGLNVVFHGDGGAAAQLEDARGHHFFAGLEPVEDGDLVAAHVADVHELLAHAAVGVAARTLYVFDDEDRVAVRRVTDRRRRKRKHRFAG